MLFSGFPIISYLLQKCFYGGQSGRDDPAEAVVRVGHVRVRWVGHVELAVLAPGTPGESLKRRVGTWSMCIFRPNILPQRIHGQRPNANYPTEDVPEKKWYNAKWTKMCSGNVAQYTWEVLRAMSFELCTWGVLCSWADSNREWRAAREDALPTPRPEHRSWKRVISVRQVDNFSAKMWRLIECP